MYLRLERKASAFIAWEC